MPYENLTKSGNLWLEGVFLTKLPNCVNERKNIFKIVKITIKKYE